MPHKPTFFWLVLPLVIGAFWFPHRVFAQTTWTRVEGIRERQIVTVAVHPNEARTLFAASSRALYRSTDGGEVWESLLRAPQGQRVTALAISPALMPVLLLATDQSLYRSSDEGRTWSPLLLGEHHAEELRHVRFLTADDALAATSGHLFITHDGGGTWEAVSIPSSIRDIRQVVPHPADADQACLVSAQALDCGSLRSGTWTSLTTAIGRAGEEDSSEGFPLEVETLIAPKEGFTAAAIDPAPPHAIYVAGTRGIAQTADGGATWTALGSADLPAPRASALLLQRNSPLMLYAGTVRGLALYQPDQAKWMTLASGLAAAEIREIAIAENRVWVATTQGLFRLDIPADGFETTDHPSAQELLSNFVHEPAIARVQEAAIRYAEVHPDKIKHWRRQAAWKAVLPTFNMGYDRDSSNDIHVDEGSFPNYQIFETTDRDAGLDLSISWDLGDLIWNPDQTSIDTRSKLMTELRDDLVDQVTRLYFERRRLQVQLLLSPPMHDTAILEKELKIRELTALIDGMTGGAFSRQMELHVN